MEKEIPMKESCLKCSADAVWEMHSLDVEDLEGTSGASHRYYCDKHLKRITGNLYLYNENGFTDTELPDDKMQQDYYSIL